MGVILKKGQFQKKAIEIAKEWFPPLEKKEFELFLSHLKAYYKIEKEKEKQQPKKARETKIDPNELRDMLRASETAAETEFMGPSSEEAKAIIKEHAGASEEEIKEKIQAEFLAKGMRARYGKITKEMLEILKGQFPTVNMDRYTAIANHIKEKYPIEEEKISPIEEAEQLKLEEAKIKGAKIKKMLRVYDEWLKKRSKEHNVESAAKWLNEIREKNPKLISAAALAIKIYKEKWNRNYKEIVNKFLERRGIAKPEMKDEEFLRYLKSKPGRISEAEKQRFERIMKGAQEIKERVDRLYKELAETQARMETKGERKAKPKFQIFN